VRVDLPFLRNVAKSANLCGLYQLTRPHSRSYLLCADNATGLLSQTPKRRDTVDAKQQQWQRGLFADVVVDPVVACERQAAASVGKQQRILLARLLPSNPTQGIHRSGERHCFAYTVCTFETSDLKDAAQYDSFACQTNAWLGVAMLTAPFLTRHG